MRNLFWGGLLGGMSRIPEGLQSGAYGATRLKKRQAATISTAGPTDGRGKEAVAGRGLGPRKGAVRSVSKSRAQLRWSVQRDASGG